MDGEGRRETAAREATIALTARQRAILKALAHSLKPVVHVGREGLTTRVVETVRDAFNGRELLKVKVHETSPVGARAAAAELVGQLDGAELVQVIGRTVIVFRPDPEDPQIRLP